MTRDEEFWKVQYELLLTALYQESNRFWTRFQVSLAVNTGLIATFFAVLNIKVEPETLSIYSLQPWSLFIISVLGVVLSSIWLALTYNGFHWQDYWYCKGKELENAHPEIKTTIFKGLVLHERAYPIGKVSYGIPITFIIAWLCLLGLTGYNMYTMLIQPLLNIIDSPIN